MKLSLVRKWGWTHVKPGRLLRVVQAHAVPTGSQSTIKGGPPRPEGRDGKWVFCREGDLAIEMLYQSGDVLGTAYLSGPAIQLNRYGPIGSGWFDSTLRAERCVLPDPYGGGVCDETTAKLISTFKLMRSGDAGVYGFQVEARTVPDVTAIANGIIYAATRAADDTDRPAGRAHIFGSINGPKKSGLYLQIQPPEHADKVMASGFQIALVLQACVEGGTA